MTRPTPHCLFSFEVESLLSVAVDSVLGVGSPYVLAGVNETSLELEQQTKQLLKDIGIN